MYNTLEVFNSSLGMTLETIYTNDIDTSESQFEALTKQPKSRAQISGELKGLGLGSVCDQNACDSAVTPYTSVDAFDSAGPSNLSVWPPSLRYSISKENL